MNWSLMNPFRTDKVVPADLTATLTYAINASSAELLRLTHKSRGYVDGFLVFIVS
jgi:hypothetical protein